MSTKSLRQPNSSTLSELVSEDLLASMRPPEPPLPPVFPSMEELVLEAQAEARKAPMTRRLLDLFDGILGDLTPLLADFAQYPQKYGEAQTELLERLASGIISVPQLSKTERLVLNLAVIDYTAPPPPTPEPEAKLASRRSPEQDDEEFDLLKHEEPEARSGAVPETELPAHWWLNN